MDQLYIELKTKSLFTTTSNVLPFKFKCRHLLAGSKHYSLHCILNPYDLTICKINGALFSTCRHIHVSANEDILETIVKMKSMSVKLTKTLVTEAVVWICWLIINAVVRELASKASFIFIFSLSYL